MNHSLARSVLGNSTTRHPFAESVEAAADSKIHEAESVQDLARRTQLGDESAFAEIYRRLFPRLRAFMVSRLHAQGIDVEEVVQEAFLKAWRNIEKFDDKFQFSTWIYTIAIRTAKDFQRSKSRQLLLTTRLAAAEQQSQLAPVDHQIETAESTENVWGVARTALTSDQYSAMWLRYGEELSIKEVSKVLGKTSVGVRVLLHRARKTLQNRLKEEL